MNQRSHERWTTAEENELICRFRNGHYPTAIALELGRSELAIRARLAMRGLLPPLSADDLTNLLPSQTRSADPPLGADEARSASPVPAKQSTFPAEESLPAIDIQQAFRRFHFVYGIVNPNGRVYVGYSQNVWNRVAQHNRDLGAVATRHNGPWFPFAIYCFAAEADACAMETLVRRNFGEFALRAETSLREVLAQIGVPIPPLQLTLL